MYNRKLLLFFGEIPPHVALSTSCLSVLTIWQLASLRASNPRNRELGRSHPFYNLASEIIEFHFCHILCVRGESLSLAYV